MSDPKDQKQEAPEIKNQSAFLKWLDNLWYHYKWPIIVGAFILFTLVVCLVQCSSREKYDLNITFAGAKILNNTEQDGLRASLESVIPSDFDGDGKRTAQLVTYGIFTEDDLKQLYTAVNSEGDAVVDHFAYNNARKQSIDEGNAFATFVKTGECAVWFVSPYVYETYHMSQISTPLQEVFGMVPDSAADEYAVRLSETDFYQYYSAARVLPENTLVLLTRNYVYGKTSDEDSYVFYTEMFRAIINFKDPN